jgi:hypothetical protein
VLSKLRHFSSAETCKSLELLNAGDLLVDLQRHFGSLHDVRALEEGTLGIGFLGRLNAQNVFIKTHRVPSARASLSKERELLSRVYPDLGADCIETVRNKSNRLWLIMEALSAPTQPPNPMQVLDVTGVFRNVFDSLSCSTEDVVPDELAELLQEGDRSLLELSSRKLIGSDIAHRVDAALNPLRLEATQLPRCLCHGDLSPANLLTNGSQLVAIDWEDAFWGVEGYDFLYWLTFMSNRRYLGPEVFGRTSLGKPLEISLMLLIILIKSEISRRSGAYLRNTLSFDDRLSEILLYA